MKNRNPLQQVEAGGEKRYGQTVKLLFWKLPTVLALT